MGFERRGAERQRRIGDRLFQAIFMAMDEGAVSQDGSGVIVAVNPAAENILGLSAAELAGRSSADFARKLNFIREDGTPFRRELDPATLALQTGKPQRNVLMGAHRPDGTLAWISFNAQPLLSDGESRPYGVVTTFRDVTERMRAEEALSFVAERGWMASKEKFFDALVKYLGKTLDVDHVMVSAVADDMGTAETVARYARGAVVPNLRYSLKGTPCENVMGRRFCFYPQGIRQMFPDDPLLPDMGAESYSGLPLWDSAGQPIGLIAVLDGKPLRDEAQVSQVLQFVATRAAAELERERNERVLRRSEQEYRTLVENMPDCLVRYDRQARARYLNPAILACVAPSALPMLGESLDRFPGQEAGGTLRHRMVERVIATGTPIEVEIPLPSPRGEMRLHQVRYVAERDANGEIVGALGIGRDVNERKDSERQLRQALEFTQGVINAIPDLLFEADRDGICLNVWARTPELLALHKEALLGKRFADVVAPSTQEAALAALREADEKGLSFGKLLRVDLPQGERWFELSVSKKPGSDVPGRFIVLSRDVTGRKRMEDDIRRRELEFRSLAENMPDIVVRYDRHARALYMNPAIVANVAPGFRPVLGEAPIETYPGQDGAVGHQRIVEQVIATGMPAEWEFQTRNPQGETRIHHARYVAERDEDGEIVGVLGIGRDITERKRMEDDIRRREQEFRSLAETMPDNVVRYDRRGRVQYFNPALSSSLAPQLMPVLGRSAADTSRGRESLTAYHRAVEQVIATGTPSEIEFQIPNPRGETRDHRVHIVAERDANGEITGALSIGRDISERKRMEQAVAAREQEFRSLAENSHDRIIRYDLDGRVRYLNSRLLAFFGKSAADVIGKLPSEVWPDGCYDGIERACTRAMETGEATTLEFDIADAAGAPRSNQVVVVPERDGAGRIIGALGFGRDITTLRETERKLRRFIENLPGMAYTFRISPDGHAHVPYVSPAIKELFGVEPDDVKEDAAPLCALTHSEDRPRIEAATAESARTMTPYRVEYRICRPDQPERWVDQRCVPEREADGSTIWYGIMLDITERKLAEEYEQFRSRTLELLSGGAPLPVILEAIVRGVERLNPHMICSILLLDKQGKKLGEGIAPSLPDFYNAAVDGLEIGVGVGCCGTVAATGERVIADDIMTHPYWAAFKGLAAKAGLAACWSEPIRASTGKVLGTFAVYHRQAHSPTAFDISIVEKTTHLVSIAIERWRAAEALRASELEFRDLAENLPDFLVRYDREGRRTYINPAMERMFQLAAEEMLGTSLQENNPTNMLMPESYLRALEHTLATGERSEFEMQVGLRGEVRTGQCFIVAERAADGQISGAIAITRDITELKRNEAELERHRHHLENLVDERTLALSVAKEAAEAATRAKSHFLAAASHDLRQPLQAIRLFNDALAVSGLNRRQKKIGNALSKSIGSLNELLNGLLDLSRLDAGTIEPQPAVIQADDLLDAIGVEFDGVCQEKNLRLRVVGPQRGLALFSDDNLLLTLLRNLVSNAVKYTRRGGILVAIRRRGDRALIQVWDTGVGIPAEQADSIFEEYFQIGNPERDRAKGVGLGLAIVKRLSKLLDAGVRFRSREGKGSVFEIRVPLAGGSDAPAAPAEALAVLDTAAPSRLAGKRIVAIEDDETAGEALKLALEMEGAEVILFDTPEGALASTEVLGADYYLSDYRLPGMNGLQLLEAIQKKSADPIKAVMLTGNVSPGQIALLRSCPWKVVLKPVALAELVAALEAQEAGC
ncbi:MAG TPA: PAS domain-containing protein [Rhodocyclaceae bacterium]